MSLRADLIAVSIAVAAMAAGAAGLYWKGLSAGAGRERPKTEAARAAAAAASAEAEAGRDAALIRDAAAVRAQTIIIREGAHREAILASPGADAPLDPRLLAAARRGLCQYEIYAGDPDCGMLQPDPAQLPPAVEAGGPAAP